jgi:hypothetical protein
LLTNLLMTLKITVSVIAAISSNNLAKKISILKYNICANNCKASTIKEPSCIKN